MKEQETKHEFDVYQAFPQLAKTKERKNIIPRIARERINGFAWSALTTTDSTFNELFKQQKELWEKFYEVSFKAFDDHDGWGILVTNVNKKISLQVTRVTMIEYSQFLDRINSVQLYLDSIKLKDGAVKCNLAFKRVGNKIEYDFILNNGTETRTATDDLKQKLTSYFNLATSYDCIPFVLWRTNPWNEDELELEKDFTTRMQFISELLPDQVVNSMTKKEQNYSSSGSAIDDEQTSIMEYTATNIQRFTMADPSYKSSNALYDPGDAIEKFTKAYDWHYKMIKDFSNSIKDDDNDSAQKTKLEEAGINRTATDQLEIHRDTFTNCIKEVIEVIHIILNEPIGDFEVTLKNSTIGNAIVEQAEQSAKEGEGLVNGK